MVLLALACPGCGGEPRPPETLDLTLKWTTFDIEEVEDGEPIIEPVRNYRAVFKPDHTFRYEWRDSGASTWEAIVGRWQKTTDEPWARGWEATWILVPESGRTHHGPAESTGRDRPIIRWLMRRSGPPGGPSRSEWLISTVDPDTRQFTRYLTPCPE